MSSDFHGSTGVTPPTVRPGYATYKSPYAPKYKVQTNVAGWTIKSATKLGMTLGGFGAAAGVFAIFFFSDIPKVRNDIMVKLPIIGDHFVKEIPPSDNLENLGVLQTNKEGTQDATVQELIQSSLGALNYGSDE